MMKAYCFLSISANNQNTQKIMKQFVYVFRVALMVVCTMFLFHTADAQYTLQDQDVTLDNRNYITACSYSFANTNIIIPDTLRGIPNSPHWCLAMQWNTLATMLLLEAVSPN